MKIFNIHGYKGSPTNSAFSALGDNGYSILSPFIRYEDDSPEQIYAKLRGKVITNQIDAIVGNSLGGFFALLLSAELNIPALVINPTLIPGVDLPKLGYDYPASVREFLKLSSKLADIDLRIISTVVGDQDEVISNPEYTKAILGNSRFVVVPEGSHDSSTLNLYNIIKDRGCEFLDDMASKDIT